MTIKELKELISAMPDDMEVFVEYNNPSDPKWHGAATSEVYAEQCIDEFWITGYFEK